MERDMDREREIDGDSNVYREIIRERQRYIKLDKDRQIAIFKERDSGRYGERYGKGGRDIQIEIER